MASRRLSFGATALVAGALVAALVHPVAGAAEKRPTVGSLRVGDAVFWNGVQVKGYEPPPVMAPDPCDEGQCWSYGLRLEEPGYRLRVAIDVPMRDDEFTFELLDPQGGRAATETNSGQYNTEAVVIQPKAGLWTIKVSTGDATDSAFRMRARLEPKPRVDDSRRLTPPNLGVIPPFEFGFVAPANPLNGSWPPDDLNPPLQVGPVAPVSCAADEMAEDGAIRCLRFSAGPTNAGTGPFHLLLGGDGKVQQRVYRADGSSFDRTAGEYEFHKTHAHNHYKDVLTYRLFKVIDRSSGDFEEVGRGVKSGFCPVDQAFADWRSFGQAAAFSTAGDCDSTMGLSTGWGDVYRWQRPGQYVEFGDNPDGLYVVRATADIKGNVLESDETDNSGYALVRIAGSEIETLERGRGLHPWDRNKTVLPEWWKRLKA